MLKITIARSLSTSFMRNAASYQPAAGVSPTTDRTSAWHLGSSLLKSNSVASNT